MESPQLQQMQERRHSAGLPYDEGTVNQELLVVVVVVVVAAVLPLQKRLRQQRLWSY